MDQMPTTALGALKLMASTQSQVDVFSDQLINAVKYEGANPLEILIQLRAFEKVSGRVIKEIMENAVTQIDRYNGKTELLGNVLERGETGIKYNFEHCGDYVWEQRKSISEAADRQLKEREEFLKALKEPIQILVEETGELQTVRPPLRTSTTSVKVTIK